MAGKTVTLTYAKAIADVAKEQNTEREFLDDLNIVKEMADESDDFYSFLNNPAIPKEERKKIIERLLQKKISQEIIHFLFLLIDNNRIFNLADIIDCYEDILKKDAGVQTGTVYSVVPLTDDQVNELCDCMEKYIGKQVFLKNEIDEDLIGGVKIITGSRLLDLSVKYKLEKMRKHLKQ